MVFRSEQPFILSNEQSLQFQITSWYDQDRIVDDVDENRFQLKEYVIDIFGIMKSNNYNTQSSISTHLRVLGFKPFFYLKVPAFVKSHIDLIQFKDWLCTLCKIPNWVKIVEEQKYEFFGFNAERPIWVLKLSFISECLKYKMLKELKNNSGILCFGITKHINFNKLLYENKLNSFIKFAHERNIELSGWIEVNNFTECDNGVTQLSIKTNYNNVKGIVNGEQVPRLCLSFDIETSGFDGFKKDKIIQIGNSAHWYPQTLSSPTIINKSVFTLKGCDKIDGIDVFSFETETELIKAWCEYIKKLDPDDLTGYNINGFDFEFIYERARRVGALSDLTKLHRLSDEDPQFKTYEMNNAAYGNNKYKVIEMIGRNIIDLYNCIQREFNLSSYKLDDVSKHFLKETKNDLPYKTMFEYQDKDDAHRKIIAEYCVQDCVLCNRLLHVLDFYSSLIGMSNVCSVPFSFLLFRGQGIKVFSQVVKICKSKNYILQTLQMGNSDGYIGARVIDPISGYYDTNEPITVLDFNSLYPNLMISNNICPSTKVIDYSIMKNPDVQANYVFNQISYVTKLNVRRDVTFAIRKDGKVGILPEILNTLLSERKKVKKMMKTESDTFKKKMLDARQLALKVSANSIYGATGAKTSSIFDIDCAACITSKGQESLEIAEKVILDHYDKSVCVYGDTDSVFFKFPVDKTTSKTDKIQHCINIGQEAAELVNKELKRIHFDVLKLTIPNTMNLEYEKVLTPLLLFTKKRYAGNLYEEDPTKCYLKSMGLANKRRDFAPIVKNMINSTLDIMFNNDELTKETISKNVKLNFISYLKKITSLSPRKDTNKYIEQLKSTIPMLTLSKRLNAKYANPDAMPHFKLAQKMNDRDPLTAPKVNDRVPFVYICQGTVKEHKKIKQSQRVEHPTEVIDCNYQDNSNWYEIDAHQYLQHLEKPVLPFLETLDFDAKAIIDQFKQIEVDKREILYGEVASIREKDRKKQQKLAREKKKEDKLKNIEDDPIIDRIKRMF